MAGAVVGALRVVLGADTALFEKGLKDAEKGLAAFGASLAKIGVGIGVSLGLEKLASSFVEGVKGAIDMADKFGKLAQSAGVTVEEFSRLNFAAELSDISTESLSKSIGKLSKAMSEVAGGGGKAGAAFTALGISITNSDGTLRSSIDVMADIAGKFGDMKDGAGKTALAMSLFGKAGAEMIPLLNQGADAFRAAMVEADELGIVISTRTAMAAEAFNDNLKRLHKTQEAFSLKIAAELVPALVLLSEIFLNVAKDQQTASAWASFLESALTKIAAAAIVTASTFRLLGAVVVAEAEVLAAAVTGQWGQIPGIIGKAWSDTKTIVDDGIKTFDRFKERLDQVPIGATGFGGAMRDIAAPIMVAKNAIDQFITSTQKHIAEMNAEALTVGLSAGAHERLKVVMEAEAIAKSNSIPITEALRLKIAALGNESAIAADKLDAARLKQENLDPWDKYAQQLERINTLLADQGERERALRKIRAEAQTETLQFASETASALTTIFKNNKAASIAAAIINTAVAITKALSAYPPPLSFAMAGLQAAAGAAQIAAIKSQKMQQGGSFTIPGGKGGGDVVPVHFMAEPGERVQVEPNSGPGGGGVMPAPVTILMPSEGFTRGDVIKLIEKLNDVARDGYRLNIAAA